MKGRGTKGRGQMRNSSQLISSPTALKLQSPAETLAFELSFEEQQ